MNWILLIVAGLFEVGFATCLGKSKTASGSAAMMWWVGFFVCLSISMFLLYKATQSLPIGTAYAVWTGIGAVGTVLVGTDGILEIIFSFYSDSIHPWPKSSLSLIDFLFEKSIAKKHSRKISGLLDEHALDETVFSITQMNSVNSCAEFRNKESRCCGGIHR